MGNLPINRVTFERPFQSTGVDHCGPVLLKEKRLRNTKTIKAYVAIFVYLATRAVHVELVSDLTTEAFPAVLKRCFARRGKAVHIFCDNTKNFVGAARELRELHRSFIQATTNGDNGTWLSMVTEKINWHFIPPRAPHFGGIWEAAVKSVKSHLIRVVGKTVLTFEAMNTYLVEIESILNSRPITPLSSDPRDLSALTPSHFLIGDVIVNIREPIVPQLPSNRLNMWSHVRQMKQRFWTRWHKEYLHQLNVRSKWHSNQPVDVKIGTLVIVKEDHLPPHCWPRGRIIELHPGKDQIVRVVTIKTAGGEYKRCIKHLSPLPIES
ncbi:uncharacterized protein LOC143341195 [Colletes latitarsis]|uniref:uncharacterized protein LOC143341195 n=1 Tax=Colletes latitarsis TaxID=2605962 RepID=UPI004036E472